MSSSATATKASLSKTNTGSVDLKAKVDAPQSKRPISEIENEITSNKIEMLDLSGRWTEEGDSNIQTEMFRIGETLKKNTSVKRLILSQNKIGDAGAKCIAEVLKVNSRIIQLDLVNNDVGDEGAKFLSLALETNRSVLMLNLAFNKIGNEGAKALNQMLLQRLVPFQGVILTGNRFDEEQAKFLYQTLNIKHQQSILNMLYVFRMPFVSPEFPKKYRIVGGLKGDALAKKLAESPNLFLTSSPPNNSGIGVGKAPYGSLMEHHDFSHYSRHFPEIDCRKLVEDALVSFYKTKQTKDKQASFRFAYIDAEEFFPSLVSIVKLALAGDRGNLFYMDLIDETSFGDHALFIRGRNRILGFFEFMALLHRMGIRVELNPQKVSERLDYNLGNNITATSFGSRQELAVQNFAFTSYKNLFPETISNPLATVSITLYDSMASYWSSLWTNRVSPDAILDIHSSRTDTYLEKLKETVQNGTRLFLLYQVCGAVHASADVASDATTVANAAAIVTPSSTASVASTIAVEKASKDQSAAHPVGVLDGFKVHFEVLEKMKGQWTEKQKPVIFSSDYVSEEKRQAEAQAAHNKSSKIDPFTADNSYGLTASVAGQKPKLITPYLDSKLDGAIANSTTNTAVAASVITTVTVATAQTPATNSAVVSAPSSSASAPLNSTTSIRPTS